jgi:type II secretory pathway pseudopilin PulG
MTLLELLTGTVIFVVAAGSSLQLWARAGAAAMEQERQRQRMEQVEAVVLRAETALRSLAPSSGDCAAAAERLLQTLAAEPPVPGLERHLQRTAGGDGVLLSLTVAGEPAPRQRLYVPAALGLCGAAPEAAPEATAPVPPQGGAGGAF